MLRNKKIKSSKKKGFSLFELIISILIFGIVLVVMSNMVMGIANLSYVNDKRLDMINQVNYMTTYIKNTVRDVKSIGTCSTLGGIATNSPVLLIETNTESTTGNPTTTKYTLRLNSQSLVLVKATSASTQSDGCTDQSGPNNITTLSSSKLNVPSFSFRESVNNGNGVRPTKVIYIMIELCDTGNRPIYACQDDVSKNIYKNTYKHAFGITVRTI